MKTDSVNISAPPGGADSVSCYDYDVAAFMSSVKKRRDTMSGLQVETDTAKLRQEENHLSTTDNSEEVIQSVDGKWTLSEEMTLVKHAQHTFDLDFNAAEISSLLPRQSFDSIKEKWKALSSSLMSMLSKRQHDSLNIEPPNSTNCKMKKRTKCANFNSVHKKNEETNNRIPWTEADLERLVEVMGEYSSTTPKWDHVVLNFPGRTPVDCITQWQSMSLPLQVKGKGSWIAGEDAILKLKYKQYGNKWSKIASELPGRTGKQCRERFVNHLDPKLTNVNGPITKKPF